MATSNGSVMSRIFGAFVPQQAPQNLPPQAQVQQPPMNNLQTPPNQVPANTAQTDPNGIIPQEGATPPPKAPESPVAKFADLWDPVKTDPSQPNQESPAFDPQKMMEAAGKVDFTRVITPETLQKIQAGGQDAIAALSEALNKTSQQVFGQASIVAHRLSEQQAQKVRDELTAQIPDMVKRQSLNQGLMRENAAFSNPAVAPVIQALQDQLAQKYPKASVDELQGMAKDYLTGVAGMINPPQQKGSKSGDPKDSKEPEFDWFSHLNS
jgi:hypothetical protein